MDPLALDLSTRRRTRRLGAALGALLGQGDVVWLEGELGAGKTFFARALLRALGVPSVVPVTSPTFSLVHEHEGRAPILHLDLYRLRAPDELRELGLEETIDDVVTVIEWGARFREVIGARGIEIALAVAPDERGRRATLRGLDARGEALVAALAAGEAAALASSRALR